MKATAASILALITALTYSCKTKEKDERISASHEVMIDSTAGSCPYLTRDNNNNIVLSWIKKMDTTRSILCYAVSKDGGKSFGNTIEVPGSSNVHPHGENLPKIVFKPSGQIIAAWGASNPNPKNPYSGLVFYSQSFDDGKTWTERSTVTKDSASFDQRYFNLTLLPDGEAGIVWLDNRKKSNKDGSGLFYAVTTGKSGFVNEKLISEPCCQCCRIVLSVDRNKNINLVYRAIIDDSIRDMVHMISKNGGKSFSTPQRVSPDNWVINGCPHTGPAMTENNNGLHFAWFTGGNSPGVYYNQSKDYGESFSPRDTVSGRSAKHCQITSLPGNNNILTVWNETFQNGDAIHSRIGLEARDAKGNKKYKQYITPENSNASFPVIYPVNENKVIVAYTQRIRNKEHVFYRQVTIE
jgi:hypothetical protein